MFFSAIHFSGLGSLWPLLAALLVLLTFVVWAYARSATSSPVRTVCAGLKMLGIAALVLCLLEPLWSRQRAKPGSNYFVVLADNSEGMQIKDRGEQQSRGAQLKGKLTSDTSWQPRSEDHTSELQSLAYL